MNKTLPANQPDDLFAAFELFSQVSGQLESSYKALECRVEQLNRELAAANSEKLRQLAEKEKLAHQLEILVETMPAAVICVTSDQVIVSANSTARRLFNRIPRKTSWQQLLLDNRISFDGHECRFPDGRIFSYNVNELENNEGYIVILTDVTQTRQLQQSLNRQQRLAELGELIAGIAHQVRTPLSSARLSLEQLASEQASEELKQRAIRRIENNLCHLEELVNDTLNFARGEEFEQDKVSISKLMLAVHESIRQRQLSGLQFSVQTLSPDCFVAGSFDALLSAIMSLVDNAISVLADQLGPELRINVQCVNDQLQIHVIDNGPGMTATQREKIFQPFYTTRKEGTGLGLAIAQSIIKAHQGSIKIESQPGQGTCMTVVLNRLHRNELLPTGKSRGAAASSTEV